MKKKKVIIFIAVVLLVVISLGAIQRLLVPKYMTDIVEGSLIESYYEEEVKDHDVLFIGDCEVYENFSPMTLWEDYGITSFIRGSAQQLIWQSYYLLEDTLRYETPDVVVFNVLSMKYDEPQNEAYNRMSIEGMKWSMSKVNAILASMTEEERFLDYVFPLLRYHSRWSELTVDDFKYYFSKDKKFHNGYYMRTDVKPVTNIPKGNKLPDYEFGQNSYKYLDMMTELCKEKGIKLVLVKAPSIYPYWYEEWDQQMIDYANKHDLMYINFLDKLDEAGIDFNTDTYDTGLHMNLSGAEKCSKYLGRILKDTYGLKDRKTDDSIAAIWEEKKKFYDDMKKDQEEELKEYGYLKSFGGQAAEKNEK